ncbi:hypothetical protein EDB84DRAFT_1438272 [Lactarius hengduanensis]|nr:hypothetical protein EDB84DRAFT_1438272 [Lactarius hengduanensis]
MDFPSQYPTQYSQYQPDGTGEGVVTPPGTYGGHTTGSHRGMERLNVIAAASEQMLEQNRFYVRLQYTSMKQKEDILALHEANSELKKEVKLLKEHNETYRRQCQSRARVLRNPTANIPERLRYGPEIPPHMVETPEGTVEASSVLDAARVWFREAIEP